MVLISLAADLVGIKMMQQYDGTQHIYLQHFNYQSTVLHVHVQMV